jgi:hypothetical protein
LPKTRRLDATREICHRNPTARVLFATHYDDALLRALTPLRPSEHHVFP